MNSTSYLCVAADIVPDTAKRLPVLFIMGPTASGKTALAVELARRFPCTIVSVDSAMVYRGMDIGTAKPDPATLRIAPHRLIDILDPVETYSAAEFRADALEEIARIHTAGRLPILTGGTMLYFRALERGLSHLPPADAGVRARLAEQRQAHGLDFLYQCLLKLDPAAAERIHPNDPQRIMRALEVCEISGCSMTELYARQKNETLPFRIIKLIVAPADRSELHRRIEVRFESMLKQGFVGEVEALHRRADLDLNKPAMRAVGYRQVWEYLDSLTDYAEMVRRSVAATRQFAKRQFTWLRSENGGLWLDSLSPTLFDQVYLCLRDNRLFPK